MITALIYLTPDVVLCLSLLGQALRGIPNEPEMWKCQRGTFLEDMIHTKVNNYQVVHPKGPAMVQTQGYKLKYMSQAYVCMSMVSGYEDKT